MARSAASLTDSEWAVFGELGDTVGRPGDTLGHPADGPIEGAAAIRLDRGPDLGLAGPPVGRPLGHFVVARPRGDGRALRRSRGRAGFSGFGSSLKLAQDGTRWLFSTEPPFSPTHGSQPGAQAGRQPSRGSVNWIGSDGTGCSRLHQPRRALLFRA